LPMKTLRILRLLAQGDGALREVDHGCSEVGSRIAARLGMSEETQRGLYQVCETWNGKGPHRLKGAEIPVAARLVNVAMIGEVFVSERGVAAAKEAAVSRSGSSFDPEIAEALAALGDEPAFWAAAESRDDWQDALDLEPQPQRYVTSSSLDEVALVFADIVDLKESGVVAHSRRTAELAEGTARRLRLPEDDVSLTRRAALVHDAGLVAVPTMILKKNGPLTAAEAERYRLHTYYTERILSHSHWLKPIGQVASAHHEATDGNGFHRGLSGNQLSMPARVLAVASAFAETMGGGDEQEPDLVLKTLAGERFDRDCLAALAAEVGVRGLAAHKPRDWPAGLTDREVEVLRQIAAGLSIRETADRLVVSNHTARHHVESIYSKLGVSSRAAAVLFAVENDLL
jgi:HD-GYP domain-containing protein (c-di-GMP phosphodiesterase class II)/DNA-binding CsgD family transcriptional regulator